MPDAPSRCRHGTAYAWRFGLALWLGSGVSTVAQPISLGRSSAIVGPAAGSESVIVAVASAPSAWTATANDLWLHIGTGFQSGTTSTNLIFSFDANSGTTRTGSISIGPETLNIIQAGVSFVSAGPVTTLASTGLNSPTSVAVDSVGNVFIADRNSSSVKQWSPVSHSTSNLVSSGLSLPNAVATDSNGNIYIADSGNRAIKKWSVADGMVTTIISSGLTNPTGVAVHSSGDVFIADRDANAVRKWSASDSNLTTVVDSGLNGPISVAVDVAGNVYIADTFNNVVKRWSAASSNVVTLIPGMDRPAGVAVDGAGNVYVANTFNHSIRKWTATTGSTTPIVTSGLLQPNGVAVDTAGNVFIANTGGNTMRELPRAWVDSATRVLGPGGGNIALPIVLPSSANLQAPFAPTSNQPWLTITGVTNGVITVSLTANTGPTRNATLTVLGLPIVVSQLGPSFTLASPARVVGPNSATETIAMAVDPDGAPWTATNNVSWLHLAPGSASGNGSATVSFLVDANPGTTRSGTLTIAGQTLTITQAGATYASATSVTPLIATGLDNPTAVAADDSGNVYIADVFNHAIKKWSPANNSVTNLSILGLNLPNGVAIDSSGSVYIADTFNHAIKKWSPTNGLTTLVGAGLNQPAGVAVDRNGNVYIADTLNNAVKKWSAANSNVVTLVNVGLNAPNAVSVDLSGNVYIADTDNHAIKKWTAAASNVTTIVSTGLTFPYGLAVDVTGDLLIADTGSHSIKRWLAASNSVVPLVSTGLANPTGVAVDPAGNIYIADTSNSAIKELPRAFIAISIQNVPFGAGSSTLPSILPPTANLLAPFAPTSDQGWLTPGSILNGVISYNFSANSGPGRVAHLTVLGQPIQIVQAPVPVPEIEIYELGGAGLTDGASTLIFGSGIITATNLVKTIVVTNAGGTNLTGLIISKSGTHSGDFIVTPLTLPDLPANTSTTFTIGFAPANLGARAAAIQVASNDSDENPFDISLAGTGISPSYSLATSNRLVGPTAGLDSLVLRVTPEIGSWSATANAPWLHLSASNQTGRGSTNITFSFDANPGGTRTGTLTVGGIPVTVTQPGTTYVGAGALTTIASTNLSAPNAVAINAVGDIYIADTGNNAIKKWTRTNNTVTTILGSGLNQPKGLAVDAVGNVYIADTGNNAVKKWIVATGSVSNLVTIGLNQPNAIALDSFGNVYIADTGNSVIKKWSVTNGVASTLIEPGLSSPNGIAVDHAGNVYFTDTIAQTIKKWRASDAMITTLPINAPFGLNSVAVDPAGSVYFSQSGIGTVQKWNAASNSVSTIISSGLSSPAGVAVDANGSLWIADAGDYAVKALPRAYVVTTPKSVGFAAGIDTLPTILPAPVNLLPPFFPESTQPWLTIAGVSNGIVTLSFEANPSTNRSATVTILGQSIAVNQMALPFTATLGLTNRVVSPTAGSDSVVLSISPGTSSAWTAAPNATWLHLNPGSTAGTTSTNVSFAFDANPGPTRNGTLALAGQTLTVTQAGSNYVAANVMTPLATTGLNLPHGIAVDSVGNAYIADTYNAAIKKWSRQNNSVTTLVGTGLALPLSVATDAAGNVYIADTYNNAVKKWNVSNATVSNLITSGLSLPSGIAVDLAGNVYIADANNNAIKKWTAASNSVTTLITIGLNRPNGVAVDIAGNVYIADSYNHAIKRWNPTNNTITTLINSGLNLPTSVAVDGAGNVYIADRHNNAIKKWTATTGSTILLTNAGLSLPSGIASTASGDVFIADTYNNTIRELPRVFVDISPRIIGNAASSGLLPPVLPQTVNLLAPFAPTSNQPWLTIGAIMAGEIGFDVTMNPGPSRTGAINVLGQSISVTQTYVALPPTLSYQKLGVGLVLTLNANPGQVYQIESAPTVTGPWTTNTVLMGSGMLSFTNPIAPVGNRFFRTRSP